MLHTHTLAIPCLEMQVEIKSLLYRQVFSENIPGTHCTEHARNTINFRL